MPVTANSIITPQTPKSNVVGLTTANTTFTTSPTNTALLVTAGANGARVTRLWAVPLEQINTANNIQLYRSYDGGTTKYLYDSKLMATVTPGAAVANTPTDFGYSDDNPLILVANERLYVAEGQTEAVNVGAEWADY
jgi:hypothetical protein